MSRLIDHGDDGDEIRTETEIEALNARDLHNILLAFGDCEGCDYENLPVLVSVPGAVSNHGLRSARIRRSDATGEWVLCLEAEGSAFP